MLENNEEMSPRKKIIKIVWRVGQRNSIVRSQRGQVAIFIAMIFQVLFILFAMAINVGMVVHDKINLQNSIDLAVYYAATKQAEMLNAMAHQNYQIRQSWKLFAWRYRVLGTMGLDNRAGQSHPTRSGLFDEVEYPHAVRPSVCVTYRPFWLDVAAGENVCNSVNLRVPPLPTVQVFAGFLGLNFQIAALSSMLRANFDAACADHGALNWWYAMSIAHAYRLDQRNRRQLIHGLAHNLAAGKQGDFVDLNGESVYQGALKTFRNNLTYENRAAYDAGGSFELLNSLEGVNPEAWVPPVIISPTVGYVDVEATPGCNASPSQIGKIPARTDAQKFLFKPLTAGGLEASDLVNWSKAFGMMLDDDYQFTLGVEKNPWVGIYMGAKAKVSPRQIFFPMGTNVELVAKAFAKPFGGRMGPWHGSRWARGALNSEGPQTDYNVPERTKAGGLLDSPDDPRRLPNYSRFPGDSMGLISRLSQNSMKAQLLAESGTPGLSAFFQYYQELKVEFTSHGDNDKLAWDYRGKQVPRLRLYELSAIAPDLFDITYYSIEPNYPANYLSRIRANAVGLGVGALVLRSDLGHHGSEIQDFSVQDQIREVEAAGIRRPQAFYYVRNKAHLLTSWVNNEEYGNFTLDTNRFGRCDNPDDDYKIKNPGSCVGMGGRTGYSVKLVAKEYLDSGNQPNGGPSESPGAIVNPPSSFGEDW